MKSDFEKIFSLDGDYTLFYAEHRALAADAQYPTKESLLASPLKSVPATVPGNFEIDLMCAGVLDDIFFGTNPLDAQKRENYHLWYAKTFCLEDDGEYDLVFEGIDTFADIYLNGDLIGSTDNMLIAHRIEAKGLHKGENELVVHIKPVFLESRKHPIGAGVITHQKYNAESLNMRKAAHMFGWDIMPRILSGGIWRSVYLVRRRAEKIEEIYLRSVKVSEKKASLRLYYQAKIEGDLSHEYTLKTVGVCGDSRFERITRLWNPSGVENWNIEAPRLWWTKDMGEQPLYDVTVELYHFDELIDRTTFRFGIRKFELKRTSLAGKDGDFCFYLNGEKLFVRGTNWVPLDALHSRDEERLPKVLALLDESNCNMIRFWGGNVYENEKVFDFCDEKGIAIWQDFGMGCATYPLNDHLCDALKKEVTAVVKKYRGHTALAAWAGDNECDEAASSWTPFGVDPNRNILTREIIPSVLNEHDPDRVYIPSSPYIDRAAWESGRPGETPEKHLWGPRDYFKSDFYTKATASFASETGYHGCPAPSSIAKFIPEADLWPWQENDAWQVHATCMEMGPDARYAFRNPLMANQIKVLFGEEPDHLDRFAKTSQASQAEAMKFFVERFRSGKWKRTGIIWWNLIDGWPQFSDAVVDYYFTRKLAYYVTKRSQQSICLMLREPENGKMTLVGANEHLKDVRMSYTVTDLTENRMILKAEATLGANDITELIAIDAKCDEFHFYVMEWEADGECGKNYYVAAPAPYDFDEYYRCMTESGMWEADGFEE